MAAIIMTTRTPMIDQAAHLHRLLTWMSPGFPIGSYTYSHGLEWAVEDSRVGTPETLEGYIRAVLVHGTGRLDADMLTRAWRAVEARDGAALAKTLETALALRGTGEQALETNAQGRAFWDIVGRLDDLDTRLAWAEGALPARGSLVPHPWAVGTAGAALDVPLPALLNAYLHGVAANLVSAGVRLIPLGQTAGQQVLARLAPVAEDAATAAQTRPDSEIGTAAPIIDLASMAHETQYTRLFRS